MRALTFALKSAIFIGAVVLGYYSYWSRDVENSTPLPQVAFRDVDTQPPPSVASVPIRLSQFSLDVDDFDDAVNVKAMLEVVGDAPPAPSRVLSPVDSSVSGSAIQQAGAADLPARRRAQTALAEAGPLSTSQFEQNLAALTAPRSTEPRDFLRSGTLRATLPQVKQQSRLASAFPASNRNAQSSRSASAGGGSGGGGGGGSFGGGSSNTAPVTALDAILQPPIASSSQTAATASRASQFSGGPLVASSSPIASQSVSDPSKFGIQNAQFWAFDYTAGDDGNGDLNGDSIIDVLDARIQFDAYLGYLEQELDSPDNLQVVSNNVSDLSRIFDQFNQEAATKQDPDPSDAISENFVSYMIIEFDSKGFYLPNNEKFQTQVSNSNAWQFNSNPDPGLNK